MGGANKVKDNYRLFMVPGMNHCGGGDGTATFDMLAALEQWVEKKQAPDQIPASHVDRRPASIARARCARIRRSRPTRDRAARTRRRTSSVSRAQESGMPGLGNAEGSGLGLDCALIPDLT